MTDEFIPIISNPELTTDSRYGGDVMINIRSLLNDIDVSPLFEGWRPKFRTQLLFRSGTIAMLDEDSSNEVHIYVDDIINKDGNVNLHIPAFTDDDDTILLQNHPQIINNKVLGTNISVGGDFDFSNFAILNATISGADNTITNISDTSLLQITDKNKQHAQTAYKDAANVFTTTQKISANSGYLLSLYRTTNVGGLDVGFEFNEQNSAGAETNYAAIVGGIVDNTAGAQSGQIKFQTRSLGSLATVFSVNHVGNAFFGRNQRLVLSEGSLTTLRIFTFPDTAGTVAVQANQNTFSAQQIFTANQTDAILIRRFINTVGNGTGILMQLQDSAGNNTSYGQIAARIGTNTDTNETGFLDFYVMKNGSLGQYLVLDGNQLSLGLSGQRVVLDATGINTTSKTFTFPNLSGQLLTTNGVQTVTDKTVSSGWTITGDVAVNNAAGLHITKNAGSGVAETLLTLDMADAASSYFTVNNATTNDNEFVPRIQTLNAGASSTAPGLYVYSNILAANDNTTTNGAIVLDGRRSDGSALTTRPILDIRNFTSNIARFNPTETWMYNFTRIQAKSGTTDFENVLELTVSDAPSAYCRIGNSYNTNTVFAPIITSFNGAAASTSSMTAFHIRSLILAANDTGSLPVNLIEGRRSDTTALQSRGILGIRNLNTDQYVFYPTFLDFTGNHIQMTKSAQPPTPAAGKVKLWVDSTSGKWSQIDEAGTVTTFGSGGGGGASAMDDLTDADTTTTPPALNDVLTWDGSNWVPAVPPGAGGGEANTISNAGTGVQLAKPKVGVDIPLRTLTGNINLELTQNTDDITFAIKNIGAFKYSIFKEGSTYYLRNNLSGAIEVSNAAPDTVFQTALTNGGDTYVYDADYEFTAASSPVLSMPLYPLYARLYLGQNVNLIVPQGYTGVLLQFRHAEVGGAGVSRCKISGGNMKEGGTRQELWTAIQFYGDAGVSVAGLFWNVVEELQIWYPKKGIHLLNASGGTKCFFNQNIFRNVIIWYPIEDGVHFDMQNAYVLNTNGFHRNRFEYVTIQGAGVTTNPNATVGFRDIRHKDNSFIGCYPVDFTGDAKTATIHADAVSTEIFGGTMDAVGYVNDSSSTKAITENGRVTTNGINPSNGSNLETIMGSSATTLTWSFWNPTFTERFYIQKNDLTGQYLFDFVKQNGGTLRPAVFRQYDASSGGTGIAESFRIETDAGLRVWTNKFRLLDSDQSHNYIIAVGNLTASRTISLPDLTANDTFAFLGVANVFSAIQKVSVNHAAPLTLYKPINTQFTQWGINFNANDSLGAEHTYAYIFASLEDATDGSKDSYIGFNYRVNNSLSRRFFIGGSGIGIGASGTQVLMNNTGLTADRTFTFPDLSGMILTADSTATITNKTYSSGNLTGNFTLPSSPVGTGIKFIKPAGSGSEKFFTFEVADDVTGSQITIENLTATDARFVPGMVFSQYATELAPAGYFLGRIDPSDDVVNEIAVFAINSRHNSAPVTNRPLFGIENYTTKEYLFYPTYADFKTKEIRNAGIDGSENTLSNIPVTAIAEGTALQVVRTNAAGNGVEWASLDSERTGKALGDGTGSATQFVIEHGLGTTPSYAFVDCSSHAINRTWTVDGTNITVNFTSAPNAGTDNVVIYWRVVA